jgi:hypothetical protein
MILIRTHYLSNGIYGQLLGDDGIEICKTLEHAFPMGWSDHPYFEPAVIEGQYLCQRGTHQLPRDTGGPPKMLETYELLNVPGHTGILFHNGNFNHDSKGCILVGERIWVVENKFFGISDSNKAFRDFMRHMEGKDKFTLQVTDDPKLAAKISKEASRPC